MPKKVAPNMVEHILSATETIIAKEGLQNLSMRKIAKEMGVAAGTLYLYFPTKDALLKSLAKHLHERCLKYITIEFDPELPLFTQYRRIWIRIWQFFYDNPTIAINLSQYKAILGFNDIIRQFIHDQDFIWNKFIDAGKAQGVLAELPNDLLYNLGPGVAERIAYVQQVKKEVISVEHFEEIISRTWKAITL